MPASRRGIEHFSKMAAEYDVAANQGFYSDIARRLLALLPGFALPADATPAPRTPPAHPTTPAHRTPARVLDLGCGSGFSTLVLLESLPDAKITAFEPSEPMAAAARVRLSGTAGMDVAVLTDAVELTALPPFDLVFANMSLHWGGRESFEALEELTAPGAYAAVALPAPLQRGALGNRVLVRAVRDVMRERGERHRSGPRHVAETGEGGRSAEVWSPAEVIELLSGFQTQKAMRMPLVEETPAEELAGILRSRGAFAALFEEEEDAERAFQRAAFHASILAGGVSTVWPVTLWVGRRRSDSDL